MLIEQIKAKDCYALRESILRPGQPIENWTFEADDDLRTIHLAIKEDEEIVGVVSLLPEKNDAVPDHLWRLRGMAITEKQLAALKKERPQLRILLDSPER